MRVLIFGRAKRDIGAAVAWWRANRPASPTRFEDELAAALLLLTEHPYSGSKAREPRLQGFRRIPLIETRYLVYYRVDELKQQVEVLRG